MALGYKKSVDEAMEGRGWENHDLAKAINEKYELTGPDLVTSDEVYEWRRGAHEPRAGFTMAALTVLHLLHLSPVKLGFRVRAKPGKEIVS
jgi:hypothetical protein